MIRDITTVATDGSLLIAIPAFAPAIVIAGVVLFVAVRNRRQSAESADADVETRS